MFSGNNYLKANPSFDGFVFTYNGPDTIAVGENCFGVLDWGAPNNPVITISPSNPGLGIIELAITISGGYEIGSLVPLGETVEVEYRIRDINNDFHYFTFSIYFDDLTPPVFNMQLLPSEITVSCSSDYVLPDNSVTDNCSPESEINITFTDNQIFDACENQVIERIYTATDERGNVSTFQLIIHVDADVEGPQIIVPPNNRVVNCNFENAGEVFSDWILSFGGVIFQDNCDSIMLSTIPEQPELLEACGETLEVWFIATDLCGNSNSASASFLINDDQAPVLSEDPVALIYYCDSISIVDQFMEWVQNNGNLILSDACSAADDLIIKPYYQEEELTAELAAELISNQTFEGCVEEEEINGVFYQGVLVLVEVTFEVIDLCGNVSNFTNIFAVIDDQLPELTNPAMDLTIQCIDQEEVETQLLEWLEISGGASGSDACGQVRFKTLKSFAEIIADFNENQGLSCGMTGSVEVAFYLNDLCGNELEEPTIATFTVIDTLPPVILQEPLVFDLECQSNLTPTLTLIINNHLGATAEDECGAVRWTQFEWNDSNGDEGTVFFGDEANYPFPNELACTWILNMTMIVEDECGNSTSVQGVITVSDNTSPVFDDGFQNLVVSCETADQIPIPHVFDNCLEEPILSLQSEDTTQGSDPNGCDYYEYTITKYWIATDACGNTSEFIQTIQVEDTEAPSFSLSGIFNVACGVDITPDTLAVLTQVIDNCSPSLDISYTDVGLLGSCPGNFRVERRWIATDACGNSSTFVQQFFFTDTEAPIVQLEPENLVINCSDASMIQPLFEAWIQSMGGAQVEDACSEVLFFAAIPESYDPVMPSSFPGSFPSPEMAGSCGGDFFVDQEIDFVFYDECDNVVVRKVYFRIIDDTAPEFLVCEGEMDISNAPGTCEAEVLIRPPFAIDECFGQTSTQVLEQTLLVQSSDPGNPEVPVDALSFALTINLAPGQIILGPAELIVNLQNVDGGVTSKFFFVENEEGMRIGQTSTLEESCESGFFVFSIQDNYVLNKWAEDGVIRFTLVPNIPSGQPSGSFIADICNGSNVSMRLTLQTSENSFLSYTYSIDGGPRLEASPITNLIEILPVGLHTIQYFATDCFGNEASCLQEIRISDVEKPELVCPGDIIYILDTDECDLTTILPLPESYSDNCGFPIIQEMKPFNLQDSLLTFSFSSSQEEFVADAKLYEFADFSNIIPGQDIAIQVAFRGVRAHENAYFVIADNLGNVFGDTQSGFEDHLDCDGVMVYNFPVSRDIYLSWYTNGGVTLALVPNFDPDLGNGILTCPEGLVENDGDTDGISFLKAEIILEGYSLEYFVTGATEIPISAITDINLGPEITFQIGQSFFHYLVEDRNGLKDTCIVEVNIIDTIAPVALCRNTIIRINPSGTINYILGVDEIDNGSIDNCEIVSRVVMPNTFDCSFVGQEIVVSLTVTDSYGLTDVCTSIVRIERTILEPLFTLDICQPDTLRLLANLPVGLSPSDYTFQWTGPNGFSSSAINPIISNVNASLSGTYQLRIQGFGGCFAEGSVTIIVPEVLGTPGLTVEKNIVCEGEQVLLETQSFSGNVTYRWYSGIAPNGTLLGTTSSPGFERLFAPGNYTFYVVVETPNCISVPSVGRAVSVLSTIQAVVNEDFIEICAGEPLQFGTPITGPDITYQWSGPGQFESSSRNPVVSQNALASNSGFYTLQIFQSGCPSTLAQIEVFVTPRPQTPILSFNQINCPGESLVLNINNIPDADQYVWLHPDGSQISTTINFLTIQNATEALNGIWSARILDRGCSSFISNAIQINIEPTFPFEASNDGPVCAGEIITLNASELPGGIYEWSGPIAGIESIRNPAFIPSAGIYTVRGTTGRGCMYESQTTVVVNDRPIINALSTTAELCVSGDDPSCFQATVIPMNPGNYTFEWTGPGFSSDQEVACIPNTSSQNNGIYTLVVTNGLNCRSEPRTIELNLKDIPPQPSLEAPEFFCEGGNFELTLQPISGATYTWITPTGTLNTIDPILAIPSGTMSNEGLYGFYVSVEGCISDTSDFAFIEMRRRPDRPVISGDNFVCAGDSIILNANFVPAAAYEWTGPSGFQANNMNIVIFPASAANEGDYSLTVTSQGCTSPAALPFFVKVQALPTAPRLETEESVLCARRQGFELNLCVLEADVMSGVRYTWYDASDDSRLGGPFASRCFNISDLDRLVDGINEFYVVASISGCLSDQSTALQVRVDKLPEINAEGGPDLIACNQDEVFVQAQAPSVGSGQWLALENFLGIEMESSPATSVFGLRPGINSVAWSLNYRSCLDYSRDTVLITYQIEPQPEDDFFVIPFAASRRIDVLQNDILPEVYTVDIISPPTYGNLITVGENSYEFLAAPNYVGSDSFRYRVCAVACPGLCQEATVVLEIGDETICDVPTIITPNDDGINDVFFIPCLSSTLFPDNKVTIFNEWGGVVFEESPYSNEWQGTYKGQPVPIGTYFFVVEFGNGRPPQKGFLMIKR